MSSGVLRKMMGKALPKDLARIFRKIEDLNDREAVEVQRELLSAMMIQAAENAASSDDEVLKLAWNSQVLTLARELRKLVTVSVKAAPAKASKYNITLKRSKDPVPK